MKIKKLNGVIKVGLGQSPSGKILEYGTHWYHFYSSDAAIDQIKEMSHALHDASEGKRKTFYSHNNRKYVEVSREWLEARYNDLIDLANEEESSKN
jgi:hypothetical protein